MVRGSAMARIREVMIGLERMAGINKDESQYLMRVQLGGTSGGEEGA